MDDAGEKVFKTADKKIKQSIAKILDKRVEGANKEEGNVNEEVGLLEKMVIKYGADSDVPLIMAMDAMSAGIDTTAHSALYFMYNLATNPEKQEILYQEICDIVEGSEEITESMLNKMSYLKAATTESLRVVSSTTLLTRILPTEIVLSGYKIPSGTSIIIPRDVTSMLEDSFTHPEEFRPERFLRGHREYHDFHAFAHIPFGHGELKS